MSIWCSQPAIGFDDWFKRARKPHGGHVRSYATGWSNHYPTTNGKVERRASIDLATIAPWCVPGNEHNWDDRATGPWLRLSVNSDVVMDEGAVRELVSQLTEWLDRPKVHPATGDA